MIQIEIDNLVSRIGRYPGVSIHRFGEAVAFVSPQVHDRFFNSVQGTGEVTLHHLDDIERLYAQHGLTPTFEIVPSRHTERLGLALQDRGYAMLQFHAGLYGRPELVARVQGVEVEEVPFDAHFAELYVASWQEPQPQTVRLGIMHWAHNQSWRFYRASVDGKAAGVAILDIRSRTALLGSAATLPEARGRRVQAALIARRIRDAAEAGCDLVVGGAYFGTTSMRNQQRAGLSIAFTRGIWGRPSDRFMHK